MKTGYTDESGYALVGSAVQEGRRAIIGLSGMKSKRERSAESVKIMRWGFRASDTVRLFDDGETVGEATVYGGEKSGVALKAQGPLEIFVPVGFRDRLKMEIVFDGPIPAPVESGQQIAKLQVTINGRVSQETLLYTSEDVEKGSIPAQAMDALTELLVGMIRF